MIKSSLTWTFLIVGTVIGAGYASGRELWQFFGHGSTLAILLFAIFFTISCFSIMTISFNEKSTNYSSVLSTIVGKRLTHLYDVIIFVYLIATTVVMIAGSGATGEIFNVSYWWGIIIIVSSILIMFSFNVDGLLSINKLLIPLLLIGLLAILTLFIFDEKIQLFLHLKEQDNWMASFPFTSLNILPLVAVIGAIGKKITSKAEIWLASLCSGTILGSITYLYNNSLIYVESEIGSYEIPLFVILKKYPNELLILMTIILWLAIFTTAAANILGLVTRLQKVLPYRFITIAILILIVVVPLSTIGFTTLISYLYPAYGIINLYVLTRLLLYPFMKNK